MRLGLRTAIDPAAHRQHVRPWDSALHGADFDSCAHHPALTPDPRVDPAALL
jgi:hypothetical protein